MSTTPIISLHDESFKTEVFALPDGKYRFVATATDTTPAPEVITDTICDSLSLAVKEVVLSWSAEYEGMPKGVFNCVSEFVLA